MSIDFICTAHVFDTVVATSSLLYVIHCCYIKKLVYFCCLYKIAPISTARHLTQLSKANTYELLFPIAAAPLLLVTRQKACQQITHRILHSNTASGKVFCSCNIITSVQGVTPIQYLKTAAGVSTKSTAEFPSKFPCTASLGTRKYSETLYK